MRYWRVLPTYHVSPFFASSLAFFSLAPVHCIFGEAQQTKKCSCDIFKPSPPIVQQSLRIILQFTGWSRRWYIGRVLGMVMLNSYYFVLSFEGLFYQKYLLTFFQKLKIANCEMVRARACLSRFWDLKSMIINGLSLFFLLARNDR